MITLNQNVHDKLKKEQASSTSASVTNGNKTTQSSNVTNSNKSSSVYQRTGVNTPSPATSSPVKTTGLSSLETIKNGFSSGLAKNGVTGLVTGKYLTKEEKASNYEKLREYASENKSLKDFSMSDTTSLKTATYDFSETAAKKRSEEVSAGLNKTVGDMAVATSTNVERAKAKTESKKTAAKIKEDNQAKANAFRHQYDTLSQEQKEKFGSSENYIAYQLSDLSQQKEYDDWYKKVSTAQERITSIDNEIAALESQKESNNKTVSGVSNGFQISANGTSAVTDAKNKNDEIDAKIAGLENAKESLTRYLTDVAYGEGTYDAEKAAEEAEVEKVQGWIEGYTSSKNAISDLVAQRSKLYDSTSEDSALAIADIDRQIQEQQAKLDEYSANLESYGYTTKDIKKLGKIVSSGVKLELGDLTYALSYGSENVKTNLETEIKDINVQISNRKSELKALQNKPESEWTTDDYAEYNFLTDEISKLEDVKAVKDNQLTQLTGKTGLIAMEDWSEKMTEAGTKELDSIVNATKVGDLLTQAGVAGVQMLMDAAIGTVVGLPAAGASVLEGTAIRTALKQSSKSMAVMMTRSFGSGVREGLEKGYDTWQAVALGVTSAATEWATEKLFGGNLVYDKTGDVMRDAYGRLVIDNASGWVTKFAKACGANENLISIMTSLPADVLSEGVEEILSDVFNPIWEHIIAGTEIEYDLEQMIEDGIVGVIMSLAGLPANLIGTTVSSKRNSAIDKKSDALASILNGTFTKADADVLSGSDVVMDIIGIDKSMTKEERADELVKMNNEKVGNNSNTLIQTLLSNVFRKKANQIKEENKSETQGTTVQETTVNETPAQETSSENETTSSLADIDKQISDTIKSVNKLNGKLLKKKYKDDATITQQIKDENQKLEELRRQRSELLSEQRKNETEVSPFAETTDDVEDSETTSDIDTETGETDGYVYEPKNFGAFSAKQFVDYNGDYTIVLEPGEIDEEVFKRLFPDGLSATSSDAESAEEILRSKLNERLKHGEHGFGEVNPRDQPIPRDEQVEILKRVAEEYGIELVDERGQIVNAKGEKIGSAGLTSSVEGAPYRMQIVLSHDNPLQSTLMHELTHVLYNSGLLNDFYDCVKTWCSNHGIDVEFEKERIKAWYQLNDSNINNLDSEFIAYFCNSSFFATEDFVRTITAEKPTVAQKIKEFLDKVADIISGKRIEFVWSADKDVRELQKMYTEAFAYSRQTIAERLLTARNKRIAFETLNNGEDSIAAYLAKISYESYVKNTKDYYDAIEKAKIQAQDSISADSNEVASITDEAAERLKKDQSGEQPLSYAAKENDTAILAKENLVKSYEALQEEIKKEENGETAHVAEAIQEVRAAEKIDETAAKDAAAAKKISDRTKSKIQANHDFFDKLLSDEDEMRFGSDTYSEARDEWNKRYPDISNNETLDAAQKQDKIDELITDIKNKYQWDASLVPNGGSWRLANTVTAFDRTSETDEQVAISPLTRTYTVLSGKDYVPVRFDSLDVAKRMRRDGATEYDVALVTGKVKDKGVAKNSIKFLEEEKELIEQKLATITGDEFENSAAANLDSENKFKNQVCYFIAYKTLNQIQSEYINGHLKPGTNIDFVGRFYKNLDELTVGTAASARVSIAALEKLKDISKERLSDNFVSEFNNLFTVGEKEQLLEAIQLSGDGWLTTAVDDLIDNDSVEYDIDEIESESDRKPRNLYDRLAEGLEYYDNYDKPVMHAVNSRGYVDSSIENDLLNGKNDEPQISLVDEVVATFTEGFGKVENDIFRGVEIIPAENAAYNDEYHNISQYRYRYENSMRILYTLYGMRRGLKLKGNLSEQLSLPYSQRDMWEEDDFVSNFLHGLQDSENDVTTIYSRDAAFVDIPENQSYLKTNLGDEIDQAEDSGYLVSSISELTTYPLISSTKYYLETRLGIINKAIDAYKEIKSAGADSVGIYGNFANEVTNNTKADEKYNELEGYKNRTEKDFVRAKEIELQLSNALDDVAKKYISNFGDITKVSKLPAGNGRERYKQQAGSAIYDYLKEDGQKELLYNNEELFEAFYNYEGALVSSAYYADLWNRTNQRQKRVFSGQWYDVDADNRLVSFEEPYDKYNQNRGVDGYFAERDSSNISEESAEASTAHKVYYNDAGRCDPVRLQLAENEYQRIKKQGTADEDNPYFHDHQIYNVGMDAILVTAFNADRSNFKSGAINAYSNGSQIEADDYWDALTGQQVNFKQLPINKQAEIIRDNVSEGTLSGYASRRMLESGDYFSDTILNPLDTAELQKYLKEKAKSIKLLDFIPEEVSTEYGISAYGNMSLYEAMGKTQEIDMLPYQENKVVTEAIDAARQTLFNPINELLGLREEKKQSVKELIDQLQSEEGLPLNKVLLTSAVYDSMPELKGWTVKMASLNAGEMYSVDDKNDVVYLNRYNSSKENIDSLCEFANLSYIGKQRGISWNNLKPRTVVDETRLINNTAAKSERGDSDSAAVLKQWLDKYGKGLNESKPFKKAKITIPSGEYNPVAVWNSFTPEIKMYLKNSPVMKSSRGVYGAISKIEEQHRIATTEQSQNARYAEITSRNNGGIQGYNYVETIRMAEPELQKKYYEDKLKQILGNKYAKNFVNKAIEAIQTTPVNEALDVKIQSLFDEEFSYEKFLKWKTKESFDRAKAARESEIQKLERDAEYAAFGEEVVVAPKEIDKYNSFEQYSEAVKASLEDKKNGIFNKKNDDDNNYAGYRTGNYIKSLYETYTKSFGNQSLADVIKKLYSEKLNNKSGIDITTNTSSYKGIDYDSTPAAKKALQDKVDNYRKATSKNVDSIKSAKAQGDLSENAEYHASKEEQAALASQLREIEPLLNHVTAVDNLDDDHIVFGSKILLEDKNGNVEYYYLNDLSLAKDIGSVIGATSEIGKAFYGKKVGDVVKVNDNLVYDKVGREKRRQESNEFTIIEIDNHHNDNIYDTSVSVANDELGGEKPKTKNDTGKYERNGLFDMSLTIRNANDFLVRNGITNLKAEIVGRKSKGEWKFDGDNHSYVVSLKGLTPLERLALVEAYENGGELSDSVFDAESEATMDNYKALRSEFVQTAANYRVNNIDALSKFMSSFSNSVNDVDRNYDALNVVFEEHINKTGRDDLRYLVSDKLKEINKAKRSAENDYKFSLAALDNILLGDNASVQEVSNAETALNRAAAHKINAEQFEYDDVVDYIENLSESELAELWNNSPAVMLCYQSWKQSKNVADEMAEMATDANIYANEKPNAFINDSDFYNFCKKFYEQKMRDELLAAREDALTDYYKSVLNNALENPQKFFFDVVTTGKHSDIVDSLGIDTSAFTKYSEYEYLGHKVYDVNIEGAASPRVICSDLSKLDSVKNISYQTDNGVLNLGVLFQEAAKFNHDQMLDLYEIITDNGAEVSDTQKAIREAMKKDAEARNLVIALCDSIATYDEESFTPDEDAMWDTTNDVKWNSRIQADVEKTGMMKIYPENYKISGSDADKLFNSQNHITFVFKEENFANKNWDEVMNEAEEAKKNISNYSKELLNAPETQLSYNRTSKEAEEGKDSEAISNVSVRENLEETIMAAYNRAVDDENYRDAVKLMWMLQKVTTNDYNKLYLDNVLRNMSSDFKVDYLKQKIRDTCYAIGLENGIHDFKIEVPDSFFDNYKNALDAEDYDAAQVAANNIERFVGKNLPTANVADVMQNIRYTAMLFNVKTHINNLTSTFFNVEYNKVKDQLASIIMKSTMGEDATKAALSTARKSGKDALLLKSCTDDFDNTPGVQKIIRDYGKYVPEGTSFKKNSVGSVSSRLLESEDILMARGAYAYSLAQRLKAMGASSIHDLDIVEQTKVRSEAIQDAKESTFRGQHEVSDAISGAVNKLRKNALTKYDEYGNKTSVLKRVANGLAYASVQGVQPFIRTPLNVVISGTNMLPAVSYAQAIYYKSRAKDTIDYDLKKQYREKAADALARSALNTALSYFGVLGKNLLSGGADDDDKEDQFKKSLGVNDYSLNIHGKNNDWSISLLKLGNIMVPIMCAVEIVNSLEDDDFSVSDTVRKVVKAYSEIAGLDNYSSVITDLQYIIGEEDWAERLVTSYLTSYVSQFIPTMYSALMKSGDKTTMKNRVDATRSSVNNVKRSTCDKWNALNNGNVRYENRPWVTEDEMYEAGWDSPKDISLLSGADGINTYSQSFGDGNIQYEFTPIKENGEILSPSALEAYYDKCIASGDVRAYDAEHDNLLITVFENATAEQIEEYRSALQKIKDKSVKESNDSEVKKSLESNYEFQSLLTKIAGSFSSNRIAKIDAWGETDDRTIVGNIFNNVLNPFTVTSVSSLDKQTVNEELISLNNQLESKGKSSSVLPQTPANSITIDNVKLTNDEYETYAIVSGQTKFEYVSAYIGSEQYANDSIYQRAETISTLYSQANAIAGDAVRQMRGSTDDVSYKEGLIRALTSDDKVDYLDALYIFNQASETGTSAENYSNIDTIVDNSMNGNMSEDVINLLAGVKADKTTGQKAITASTNLKDLQTLSEVGIGSQEYYEKWKPTLDDINGLEGNYSELSNSDKASAWEQEITKTYGTNSPKYVALMSIAQDNFWNMSPQISDIEEEGDTRTTREKYFNLLNDEDAATAFSETVEGDAKRYLQIEQIRNTSGVTDEQKIEVLKSLSTSEKYSKRIDKLFASSVFEDWTTNEILDALSLFYECDSKKAEFKKQYKGSGSIETNAVASALYKAMVADID